VFKGRATRGVGDGDGHVHLRDATRWKMKDHGGYCGKHEPSVNIEYRDTVIDLLHLRMREFQHVWNEWMRRLPRAKNGALADRYEEYLIRAVAFRRSTWHRFVIANCLPWSAIDSFNILNRSSGTVLQRPLHEPFWRRFETRVDERLWHRCLRDARYCRRSSGERPAVIHGSLLHSFNAVSNRRNCVHSNRNGTPQIAT